jgi:hypothetical protein
VNGYGQPRLLTRAAVVRLLTRAAVVRLLTRAAVVRLLTRAVRSRMPALPGRRPPRRHRDLPIPWTPPQPDHHTLWSLKSDAPGAIQIHRSPSLSPFPARNSPVTLQGAARGCNQHSRTT